MNSTNTPFSQVAPWLQSFDTIFPIGIPPLPPEDACFDAEHQPHLEWEEKTGLALVR